MCAEQNENVTYHDHHLLPQRYGGPDKEFNLVTLCPTCHSLLENLYTDQFWQGLGFTKTSNSTAEEQGDAHKDVIGKTLNGITITHEGSADTDNAVAIIATENELRIISASNQANLMADIIGYLDTVHELTKQINLPYENGHERTLLAESDAGMVGPKPATEELFCETHWDRQYKLDILTSVAEECKNTVRILTFA